jgi:type IV pilus assembly protein PilC
MRTGPRAGGKEQADMPRFAYQVRDIRGGLLSGVLAASDVTEASRQLRGEGHVIVELHEQQDSVRTRTAASTTRVRRGDVIVFASQLAVMVDTGVPLTEALDAIASQIKSESFKPVLVEIADQVKAGGEFSSALATYPRIFDHLFVSMVRASEASGTMGAMLQRVAKYLEKQRALRRQVKGAMAYPVAMLGFCLLVVIGMLTFILPRFEKIYGGKSQALPAPTRALLVTSDVFVEHWPFILAGAVLAALGTYAYARSPEGQRWLDGLRLRLPVLGNMFRRASLARSLRTLAAMVNTGVNVLESLEITAEVSGNRHYADVWRELGRGVKEGGSLSNEMLGHELIPRSVTQMVAAGERSGRLGSVLDRVAGFCEEDLEASVRVVTSFIEPAMIVVMGTIIGGIALALLLPVFSLSKIVAH